MALVEIELRGGVPFATTVLYTDLTAGAHAALGGRHLRSPIRHLEGRDRCPTCEYVAHAQVEPEEWREHARCVDLVPRLHRLSVAVRAYEKSPTADGRPVDRRGATAWLHALGWFAGWRFPAEA